MPEPAVVYLVGAGPGAPGLLTLRGRECLRLADTVVYDHLANPVLLGHATQADEFICVGKRGGEHTLPQEAINALLVAKAQAGRTTVRLKGGDPFVFGRGGEEALALAAAGIRFEVVPGVTAGIAAPACAGIPVTHRGCNSVLTLVTGHEDPGKPASAVDWGALAAGGGTLVFYMGVRNLPGIVERLLAHGRPARTPVAVIRCGTLPEQQVVTGTLADIAERARQAALQPPALIVVGEVVALREQLHGADTRPLAGLTVAVTRAPADAAELTGALAAAGATVLSMPTLRIEPPADSAALRAAVARLDVFDWILFPSAHAVDHVFHAVHGAGGDSRRLAGCRVAAVGTATADALRAHGIVPDLVPPRFTSAALGTALAAAGEVRGTRVFLPQSQIAPATLSARLRAAGAKVTAVTAYRTLPAEPSAAALAALREARVDLVLFASASAARHFAAWLRGPAAGLPGVPRCACIGPATSRAARAEGFEVAVEADVHTAPGLVRALVARFGTSASTVDRSPAGAREMRP